MVVDARQIGDRAVAFVCRYGWVNADVLHDLPFEEHQDKRVIGSVLAKLAQKGVLRPDGYRKSRRPKCHHRPIVLYRLGGAS